MSALKILAIRQQTIVIHETQKTWVKPYDNTSFLAGESFLSVAQEGVPGNQVFSLRWEELLFREDKAAKVCIVEYQREDSSEKEAQRLQKKPLMYWDLYIDQHICVRKKIPQSQRKKQLKGLKTTIF